MEIREENFGKTHDGIEVIKFKLSNDQGLTASVINFGAILISLKAPDRTGKSEEVTLGFDTLEEYLSDIWFFGATIGQILYGLLTYAISLLLDFPLQSTIGAGLLVFFLYLGSRLLILFSGIDTLYYSKGRKDSFLENTPFYKTAQWVGNFYHYHDSVLFIFLVLFAISFLISVGVDGWSGMPLGRTAQDLWNLLILMP